MSLVDEAYDAISTEPWSFLIGALFGFLVSNRWSLVRRGRNGNQQEEKR